MSKQYEIRDIDDLIQVARETDNPETLKADLCEFIDIARAVEPLDAYMKLMGVFKWNDDGVTGLKKVNIVE